MKMNFKSLLFLITTLFSALLAACGQTPVDGVDSNANSSSIPAATNLVAKPTPSSINLTWANPDYSGDFFIRVQHRLKTQDDFIVDATLSGKTSYTIADLETAKDYEVRLQSLSKDGSASNYTNIVAASTNLEIGMKDGKEVIEPSVINLAVKFNSYDSRTVTWNYSDTDLTGISSWDLSIKRDSATTFTTLHSSTSPKSSESYIDASAGATTVAYRVTMHYDDDTETVANFDSAAYNYSLPGLINLSASYNSYNSATVKWGWSSSDLSSIASYDIYRQKYNDGTWTKVNSTSITTIGTSYTDSDVQATTVKYRVAVKYDDTTVKNFDMTSSISFNLPTVNTLAAVYNNYNSATFSWTWSSSDLTSIGSYDVYRQVLDNGTWTKVNSTSVTTIGTSYIDTNPAAVKVKYRLTVHYKDDKLTTTNFDMSSDAVYALPATGVPVASWSSGAAHISWTWTNTTHYDVLASYKVQRSIYPGTPSWSTLYTNTTSLNPPATSYIDSTVGNDDGSFIYRIEVTYKSGGTTFDSGSSGSVSYPSMLATPTISSFVGIEGVSGTVNWTYALNAVNVDGFTIQYSAKTASNGSLDTETFYRDYTSTISAYSQKILITTICSENSADHVDFYIQANPANANLNTASVFKFAGTVECGSGSTCKNGISQGFRTNVIDPCL